MMHGALTYLIPQLPDPAFPQYQLAAGGDVRQAIWRDCEHLARAITNYPPGSLAITIRLVFEPLPETGGGDVQSRLKVFLSGEAQNPETLESLRLLIEQGPLSRFYEFIRHDGMVPERDDPTQVVEVVRRTASLAPLHGREFNDRIPESYYVIEPFQATDDNDFLALDGVLNKVRESVVIELRLQPAEVAEELAAHTSYLARLQSINHTWGQDDDPGELPSQYLKRASTDEASPSSRQWLKPFRLEDPLADQVLRGQQRFHESLARPHVQFSFKVLARSRPTAQLVASVFAEAAFAQSTYRLIGGSDVKPAGETQDEYPKFGRLTHLATVDEIAGAFRLPVASHSSPLCIRRNTDPPAQHEGDMLVLGHDMALAATGIGDRKYAARGPTIRQLTSHLFFSGVTGCGKTTACILLLLSLYSRNVPFLIFEMVKTQYRIIKTLRTSHDPIARGLAKDLELYTPGKDSISPFRFNPLQIICPDVTPDEHIGNMMGCFMASFPMLPALPSLLQETLESLYEEHVSPDHPPSMADLAEAVQRVLQSKRYSGDTNSDFRAALDVRLGSLLRGGIGKVFQSRTSTPSVERLMSRPSLIEFDYLSPDNAALLALFLLVAIREHLVTTTPNPTGGPRLVLVLEEAHLLAGSKGQARASEEVADPRAFAAEAISRLLLELRALGVVVVILDQHPSALAPEVIKSTGTKLAFRQVHSEDREELGAAMLFGPLEMEGIARLLTGQAYFFAEGHHRPCQIQTVDPRPLFDLNTLITRQAILPHIITDDWFKEVSVERALAELTQLKEAMDAYDVAWLQLLDRLVLLLAARETLLSRQTGSQRPQFATLKGEANDLKAAMYDLYQSLRDEPYRRFILQANPAAWQDESANSFKRSLIDRFAGVVEPGFTRGIGMVDDLSDGLL